MDPSHRISQFENMVQADPTNDMAHFSLGGAYAQAGRHFEAAESYLRCIQLNPDFSKAYQLAGQAFIDAGKPDRAGGVLEEGYKVAAERGDRMPQKAIGDLLKKLGMPVPETSVIKPGAGEALPTGFVCARTGRPGTKMTRPPFKGPVGEWIGANISQETFRDWIAQGTKVINELRLDLSREEDSETYDRHMREYLGIDEDLHARLVRGPR